MNRESSWLAVLPSLLIPICLGLAMHFGLSTMIEKEVITNETLIRYLTGHSVSKATMILFFIGAASLLMIAYNIFTQYRCIDLIRLNGEERDSSKADVDAAVDFADSLIQMPENYREHYLWRRLHEALHFIHRTGSTLGIEDETKYLSELDTDRHHQRYSLVRIMIWATPMLGFLGTVLGISQALGGIDVGPDNDFQQMMGGLKSSLYVAFDTTALALLLSIVLMFGQFLIDRFESQLLRMVDYRTRKELSTHFALVNHEADSLERITNRVKESTDQVVEQQAKLWRETISAAETTFVETVEGVNSHVQGSLSSALGEAVESLGQSLDSTIRRADESMTHRWQQWQVMLSDSARNADRQRQDLIAQTEMMKEMVDRFSDSENSMNDSLREIESSVEKNGEAMKMVAEAVEEFTQDGDKQAEKFQLPGHLKVVSQGDTEIPEIVTFTPSERPQLKIFRPDGEATVLDSEDDMQPGVPRYRYAEEEAGLDSVESFPVQIDQTNRAA